MHVKVTVEGKWFKWLLLLLAVLVMSCLAVAQSAAPEPSTNNEVEQPAQTVTEVAAQAPAVESEKPAAEPEKQVTKSSWGPIKLSWDTTLKYSSIFRVAKPSAVLSNPATNPISANFNDGDANFHRGLVSSRVDLLSEMDIAFGPHFGVRGSMAAWTDPVYNSRIHNQQPGSYNGSDPNHFAPGTKDLQYLYAEPLDWFLHGDVAMGEKNRLSFRGGQFAQQWGQTLFFGSNGIAGAMAPTDLNKFFMAPNSQFKEIIRPVPQVAVGLQLSRVLISGYYQLQWEPNRLASVGSYFSISDIAGAGAERMLYGVSVPRLPDVPTKQSGQFGVQVQIPGVHGMDFGFYAAQFHEKSFQIYFAPDFSGYAAVYPLNIKTIGMSVTTTRGSINWAAEVSGRWNQDLTGGPTMFYTPVAEWKNNGAVAYPVGNTIHANLSAMVNIAPNRIVKESSLMAEVAWNDLLSVTKNRAIWQMPNPGSESLYGCGTAVKCNTATRNAAVFMMLYEPIFRQVRPGIDLSVPAAFSFSPYGRSVLAGFNTYHGGFFNVGGKLTYHDANTFTITYQRFIGEQGALLNGNGLASYQQVAGDRNYIAVSIYRSFGFKAQQKPR